MLVSAKPPAGVPFVDGQTDPWGAEPFPAMQGVEEVVAPSMAEVAVGRPNHVVSGGVSTRGARNHVPGTA